METRTQETAMMAPPLAPAMTAEEVAAALQYSAKHFNEIRQKLEATGFPRRMPGTARWSRRAVMDWIHSGGQS